MKILIYVEHNHKEISQASLHCVSAALQLSSDISLIIFGHNCNAIQEEAKKIPGVTKILLADNPAFEHFLAENQAPLLAQTAKNYSMLLAGATTQSKDILPRSAALLNVCPLSEVTGIIDAETFIRPIYAGNAYATVKNKENIKVLTIRPSAFAKAEMTENQASIETLNYVSEPLKTEFVSQNLTKSERPELNNAKTIISGGRGLQSKENFVLLEELATKLNAAIGATRAAVDAGFVPNDYQVGQTGKIVAPNLYIAIGISGAIQHIAGMKDSKVIVAINKDPDAPIFKIADYGLVGDLFEIVPKLADALTKKT